MKHEVVQKAFVALCGYFVKLCGIIIKVVTKRITNQPAGLAGKSSSYAKQKITNKIQYLTFWAGSVLMNFRDNMPGLKN